LYTETARKANVTGSVRVALFVTPAGFPRDIRVIRGLPYGLNRKAIDAVSHWHFTPAMQNGQPILAETEVEVQFQ
jgi:protein TonB